MNSNQCDELSFGQFADSLYSISWEWLNNSRQKGGKANINVQLVFPLHFANVGIFSVKLSIACTLSN